MKRQWMLRMSTPSRPAASLTGSTVWGESAIFGLRTQNNIHKFPYTSKYQPRLSPWSPYSTLPIVTSREYQPSTEDWYNYVYFYVTYLYKDTVTSLKLPISVVVHISTSHAECVCVRSARLNKMLDDKIVLFAWPSQGLQCKCNVYSYPKTRPHISTLSLLSARCLSNSRVIPV